MRPNSRTASGPSRRFAGCLLILLALAALSRIASWFYTVSATDVAFADWVAQAVSYLAEFLVAARLGVSVGCFTAAYYEKSSDGRRSGWRFLAASVLASAADYAARFFIDLLSGSIAGAAALAGIWVVIQFLLEALLLCLAFTIVRGQSERYRAAETSRARKKHAPSRANLGGIAVFFGLHLLTEAYYLFDFLTTYTGITGTEIASIVGSFLRIFVLYGGAAFLVAEGTVSVLLRRNGAQTNERADF